jgi:hypothetical protein
MRLILALLLLPALACAGELRLAWDANKETNLAGYKVYRSRDGKNWQYTATTPVNSITLNNISTAIPSVWAVTAFNNNTTAGTIESGRSNRVRVSMPKSQQRGKITGTFRSAM